MTANETSTYIFNPEHDLALAYGNEGYTAPPRAQLLRRDLQMLPAWYCLKGADILSQNTSDDNHWLGQMEQLVGMKANAISINRLQCRHSRYHPWGWDLDLRQRLLNVGIPCEDLPSRENMLKIQQLSHRRTSIIIHQRLKDVTGINFSPIPIEVNNVAEIRHFNAAHPCCYIKAPWSGSGKGIYRVLNADCRSFATWAQGIINRQGSIMCEQPFDKVLDFAMEFQCTEGKTSFAGYSVFVNDNHCSYDSSIVATQATLEHTIISQLGASNAHLLTIVSDALCAILSDIITPYYEGYLGIDMMVYNDNGTIRLNPCVELNLRMTMGVVSSFIADRIIQEGGTSATFRVTYFKSHEELAAFMHHNFYTNAPVIDDHKLISGFMPLTPIYNDSQFLAYLAAKPNEGDIPPIT